MHKTLEIKSIVQVSDAFGANLKQLDTLKFFVFLYIISASHDGLWINTCRYFTSRHLKLSKHTGFNELTCRLVVILLNFFMSKKNIYMFNITRGIKPI